MHVYCLDILHRLGLEICDWECPQVGFHKKSDEEVGWENSKNQQCSVRMWVMCMVIYCQQYRNITPIMIDGIMQRYQAVEVSASRIIYVERD